MCCGASRADEPRAPSLFFLLSISHARGQNNYRQVTPIRMAMDQIEIEEQGEENKQESGRRENAQTWIIKSEGRHGRGTVNAESASEGESVRRVSFFENGTPTKDPVRHSEAESGGCTCS